jgi:hypothetical protein
MPNQPKPKRVGRSSLPKGEAKGETLRIRVTLSELRAFEGLAKVKKLTVSEWIHSTLEANLNG